MRALDLRIGDTAYMKPYWAAMNTANQTSTVQIGVDVGVGYGPDGGIVELKHAIKNLHRAVGNAEVEGKHIVVGNGATQVVMAALQAQQGLHVYTHSPYWFKFPEMFDLIGWKHKSRPLGCDVEVMTLPNNPDNEHYEPHPLITKQIYDLCYAWPQYTDTEKLNHDIMIFSLSKATGHAASRIGWAVVTDPRVAAKMDTYIDLSTSGVSFESQVRAGAIIKQQCMILGNSTFEYDGSCFAYGGDVLQERWDRLKELPEGKFKVLNSSGMFAWCEYGEGPASADLRTELKILGVPGPLSGGKTNQVRIAIGCSDEDFKELIIRLTKANLNTAP